MTTRFIVSVVEDAGLASLETLRYSIAPGPVIALGELVTPRDTPLLKLISGELRVKRMERTAATI